MAAPSQCGLLTATGQILYNHLPILTPLTIGEVRVQRGADVDHKVDHIAVSGGIIEFANNVATIIADNAERACNIDLVG